MNSKEPVEVRPLPCPFCDAKAWICEDDDDDTLVFQIGCTTFGCRGLWKDSQVFMTRDEALAPWNRRASLSSEPAIVVRRLGELADRLDDAPDDAWDTVEYVAADLRNLRDKIASGSASTASGRPVTDEDVDRAMRLFGLDVSHDHPDREAMRNVLRYDRANQRSAPSEAAAQSGAPVPTTKEQQ